MKEKLILLLKLLSEMEENINNKKRASEIQEKIQEIISTLKIE